MNIRHSNGWLRKTGSVRPGMTLGNKMQVHASNHLGFEVQELVPGKGWISAILEQKGYQADGDTPIYKPMIVATKGLAEDLMEGLKSMPHGTKNELRVYEAVQFPVKVKV